MESSGVSRKRVTLGVTGSVAAYKAAGLARSLMSAGIELDVVLTHSASRFIGALTFAALTGREVYEDEALFSNVYSHLDLARLADMVLIAPASLNIVGKCANGIADDLLSTVLAATDPAKLIFAPAMNSRLYLSAPFQSNMKRLAALGARFIGPESGSLACSEEGPGRFASIARIEKELLEALDRNASMVGFRAIVTVGATREPIDHVRYISNRSSGKMGVALARALLARGADVTLIAGALEVDPPGGLSEFISVLSAAQLEKELLARCGEADMIFMAAAVADLRPKEVASGKIKKDRLDSIELTPNNDIIALVSRENSRRAKRAFIVGFAAECDEPLGHGALKLEIKQLDMIVINDVSRDDIGFGSDYNAVSILTTETANAPLQIGRKLKREIADVILDEAFKIYRQRRKVADGE